ncbi:restin homolog [Daphnia pulex]|uniref:restin homolog n=1 Tax=Daphnia pulex TaxID=6669 RepID=UPI001EDE4D89|nr:restin homolog [Daphnia pulex]XP_046460985.1 restin homolog [Daphnia pulex]XP_046460986.1 restin homolog [Daphnia pulex]
MKMSETSEDIIDIIDLVSDDEEITPCQKASRQNVPSSEVEKCRDYVCISCINKSLTDPSGTRDLNCILCTLSNSDTAENKHRYWCYICNNLASHNCHTENHEIENYNHYYHTQSILIKSNMKQTNLACDEALQDCQKTEKAVEAIIAWIRVLLLGMTQRDSSSTDASFQCQVFIAQLESLKTAGVFHVAEEEDSGILSYISQLTTHFTDRSTEVQAAQTKIRNLLEKCSIQQESSQSSQYSNGESSPDLINKLTTALHHNNKSYVDVLISLLKEEENPKNDLELDLRNSETENPKKGENIQEKIDEILGNCDPLSSCSGSLGHPKRRADEEPESDTARIYKKRRGFSNGEIADDQHVRTSPLKTQSHQSQPISTPSVDNTISKEAGAVIGSGISVGNYLSKFNEIRSDLAQNLQEAQIRLKILEEGAITLGNEEANRQKLSNRIAELEADLAAMVEKVKLAENSEAKARQETSNLLKHAKEVQEKYEKELIRHTADVEQLNSVREEMEQLEQNHSQLEARLALLQQTSMQLETEFISDRTSWQAEKDLLEKESAEKDQRCAKRKRLIGALQNQITSLSSHITEVNRCQEILMRALSGEDTDSTLNSSDNEVDIHVMNQLLKMVRCFRHDKDNAVSRSTVLETEFQRLKMQLEEAERQANKFQTTLSEEREERKVLTDSHRLLKDEKDNLSNRVEELSVRVNALVSELESLQSINQQSSCDLKELTEENEMLNHQISLWKAKTDMLQENAEKISKQQSNEEPIKKQSKDIKTLAEMKQFNMQLITVKLELEQAAAAAKEDSEKSKSRLVEALAKFDEKTASESEQVTQLQQIALEYKTQYENLKVQHDNLIKEHEEICAVQTTRIQELGASIGKINEELEEFKKKNLVQEKFRGKVRLLMEERSSSNRNLNKMPQLVPINVTPVLPSATLSDHPLKKNQEQFNSSLEEINSHLAVASRPDIIPLASATSSDSEAVNDEATFNQESDNLFDREFEFLVHTQNCQHGRKVPNGERTVCLCHPLKIMLKHSTSCNAGEMCPVPDCWFSLSYQSEEVSTKIARLESDLLFVVEQAELAEESEAAAHQQALNEVKRAMEDRERFENELLRRTAEVQQLKSDLEQTRSQLTVALEQLNSRATLDEIKNLQSGKESAETELKQIKKEVEQIKKNVEHLKKSEISEKEERVRVADEEIKNLQSHKEKLEKHQEQLERSQTILTAQLKESQKINTQLVAEKENLEGKVRAATELIRELRPYKKLNQTQLEQMKQSHTSLTEQLANSQQSNTQLIAANRELEEQNHTAVEEIKRMEFHKEMLQLELEGIKRLKNELVDQFTESQVTNTQLMEAKMELEAKVRAAEEESQKLLSEMNTDLKQLNEALDEVTRLREVGAKYEGLKNCYNKRKLELASVFQEKENLRQQVDQLSIELEETKKESQADERIRKKPRLLVVTEETNTNQQTPHQQDQQNVSVMDTATSSILMSCNKVPNKSQQQKSVSTSFVAAPTAAVVPPWTGTMTTQWTGIDDSEREPVSLDVEDNPISRKLFTTRHNVLNHARKCPLRMKKSKDKCHVPLCLELAAVLDHITKCKAGASCRKAHCLSSQKIIPYWKLCKQKNCPLCYVNRSVSRKADKSEVLDNNPPRSPLQKLMDERFCSSQRFESLAMAMLTQLHNSWENKFVYPCNNCKSKVETRFRCNVCTFPVFELCVHCYKRDGHCHQMDEMGFGLDVCSSNAEQTHSHKIDLVARGILALAHSLKCDKLNCDYLFCDRMKIAVKHMHKCEISGCPFCCQLVVLIIYHVKHSCPKLKYPRNNCTVPFCNFLNGMIASTTNASINSAFANIAYVTKPKDPVTKGWNISSIKENPGVSGTNLVTVLPQHSLKETETKTQTNSQLILPSELRKYSEFGVY